MIIPSYADCASPQYFGLRLGADEYLALPQDGYRYELLDGIVCLSPSPALGHQRLVTEVLGWLATFLHERPVGEAVFGVDVRLGPQLVYRPDVIYLRADKAARCADTVTEVPDLVVEIVSPHSRSYDGVTKRGDYEKAGVGEYWLVDAQHRTFTAFVNRDGRFVQQPIAGDTYRATQPPGFELDLARLSKLF